MRLTVHVALRKGLTKERTIDTNSVAVGYNVRLPMGHRRGRKYHAAGVAQVGGTTVGKGGGENRSHE